MGALNKKLLLTSATLVSLPIALNINTTAVAKTGADKVVNLLHQVTSSSNYETYVKDDSRELNASEIKESKSTFEQASLI